MKRTTLCLAWAILWGIATAALAEDAAMKPKKPASPDKKPAAAKADTQADASATAALRAKIHRTMAELLEAQAVERPDQERVRKLTEQLQDLRQDLSGTTPTGLGRQVAPPRMTLCRGAGRGPGMGYGPGRGMGPGAGRWAGTGRGAAVGAGPSAGRGLGTGRGGTSAFVDEDKDGVCDNYQRIWGTW